MPDLIGHLVLLVPVLEGGSNSTRFGPGAAKGLDGK